jgi:hypothetical protein
MSGENKGKEDGIRNPKYGIGGYRGYIGDINEELEGEGGGHIFICQQLSC